MLLYFVGNYWIDPNGGVRDDAVLAFCHFESQSSCVLPKNLKVSNLFDKNHTSRIYCVIRFRRTSIL